MESGKTKQRIREKTTQIRWTSLEYQELKAKAFRLTGGNVSDLVRHLVLGKRRGVGSQDQE